MILRGAPSRALILLSRVSPEDVSSCEERYNKSKMVHSIVRHVAELCGVEMMVCGRRGLPHPAALTRFSVGLRSFAPSLRPPLLPRPQANLTSRSALTFLPSPPPRLPPPCLTLRS